MTYAEAVKLLRKKLMLTQTEFAEFIGVAFGTVNRWEGGQYDPTMKMRRKLAPLFKKYGIEVEVK